MANTTSPSLSSSGVNDTVTVKSETIVPFGEEDSAFFPGLTKAEEVIAWAGITVAILGLTAILLRLIMPLVRRKCRKDKGDNAMKNAHLRGSSGQLIDGGMSTPSSASRASTLSRGSNLDDLKARYSDDATSVTTISGSQDSTKNPFYGNLSAKHLAVPVYLPRVKSTGSMHNSVSTNDVMHNSVPTNDVMHNSVSTNDVMHNSVSSQELLNTELTQVLSTPQLERLKSLDLSDSYRNNWDRPYSPDTPQPDSLSHHGYPSAHRGTPQGSPRVHPPEPQSSPSNQPELKTRF